jgi:hypothetical protein
MGTQVVTNRGRLINTIAGINGVVAGGVASIKFDCNRRYHRVVLQTAETVGGTPATPTSPATVLSTLQLLVNGVKMWDVAPQEIMNINAATGITQQTGELTLAFTDPSRKFIRRDTLTSWDMAGQSTFEVNAGIGSGTTAPLLTGIFEFDYIRNMRTPKQAAGSKIAAVATPFIQPVARHTYTFSLPGGISLLNTLPISAPIARIWLRGSPVAQISALEVLQDNNKVLDALVSQINEAYGDYGYTLGNANGAAGYDTAFISDPNGRPWLALKCQAELVVKVTTLEPITLTAVIETLPGSYR